MSKNLLRGLFMALSTLVLVNCGGGGGGGSNSGGVTAVTPLSSCTMGQVYNQSYGCLPQNSCPYGQGWYNNSCVTGTVVTTNNMGMNGSMCQGMCPAGQTQTAYGCLPTCTNAYGSCGGMVSGSCVTGYSSYSGGYYGMPYWGGGGMQIYWYRVPRRFY